jgi:hypothetical protein
VAEAVDEAAEDAGNENKLKKGLDGPLKCVRDATKKLSDAIDAYREVGASEDFEDTRFRELLSSLTTTYDALREEVGN